jgi:hypothetical protein
MQCKARLDELAKEFEEMEHQQFGKDGFEDGIERMARVEELLGLADLNTYTAHCLQRPELLGALRREYAISPQGRWA